MVMHAVHLHEGDLHYEQAPDAAAEVRNNTWLFGSEFRNQVVATANVIVASDSATIVTIDAEAIRDLAKRHPGRRRSG